ncbi:Tetraacyldisaccharide 4'-kinase [Desulfosarcina cetonica]|nr:Tetraacyldisaccharide 4'-kinase [Desulfosarcina cetonica]
MRLLIQPFEHLRRRIMDISRNDWPSALLSLETLLSVLSTIYGGITALRASGYAKGWLKSRRLPCKVVSIGNLVAGGTGKTPMTIYVAQLLHEMGWRVVVLSRGYRGRMETMGGVVSDGHRLLATVEDAGDEPYLMARCLKGVPVLVGRQRYQAGLLAIRAFGAEVIVLDDAFQHLKLKRDLNLVLLDHHQPFGNGHLLPRGLLREPLSSLRRAHAWVFTRCDGKTVPVASNVCRPANRPFFYSIHHPVIRLSHETGETPFFRDPAAVTSLQGKRVVAFAGLADNEQFFASLRQVGCEIIRRVEFKDHHRYTPSDIHELVESAIRLGVDCLVTTTKDDVKIDRPKSLPIEWVVVDVQIGMPMDGERFRQFLMQSL